MSKFSEFINKVKEDEKLQAKLKVIRANAMKKIVALAKEEGIELKPEEISKGELSDEALEEVAAAGGGARGDCNTGYAPLY